MPDRITPADVRRNPDHYIRGAGQDQAAATDCPHGYSLLSSCGACDSTEED